MMENLKLLEWYYNNGVDFVVGNNTRNFTQVNEKIHTTVKQDVKMYPKQAAQASQVIADNCKNLEELYAAIQAFDGCILKKTATNTVLFDGNPNGKVMLVGEAPGATEDERGIPFCGLSGQLLDKVIASIGLTRQHNAYITNSVFWRPPGNRKPTDEEIKICAPFVQKHISLINPDLIIVVGSVAYYSLFGEMVAISKQRQKVLEYKNQYLDKKVPAVVIFHPSYLLRQPSQKKLAWQDMLFIQEILARAESR